MRTRQLFTTFVLLALLLSACNAKTAASSDSTAVLDAVYTAAALTLSAQAAAASATPTLKPSATSTPFATATLIPSSTAAQQYAPVSANVVSSASGCDNSAFINDVTISDGTVFAPGESFTKTWSFQNSGSCTWTTSYSIVFVSGSSMSGSATALTTSVNPGGQINASVDMVAPITTGAYTGYWKLQNAAGASFGQSVYVQIVVSSSAATITPTPTSTNDESSYTSTPTSTSVSTSTTAPTSTTVPTATAAPTNTTEPTETPAS